MHMEGLNLIVPDGGIIVHPEAQGTDEWKEARAGKMTASHAKEISTGGAGLNTYIIKMLRRGVFGELDSDFKSNEFTRGGNRKEPLARAAYELKTGNAVREVGFIQCGDYAGFSPDGLVGDTGGCEIKCREIDGHWRLILTETLEPKEYAQIQMSLLLSGRKWWDYIAFNPDFKTSLWIKRILPDQKAQEKILKGLGKGVGLIKRYTATKGYLSELEAR